MPTILRLLLALRRQLLIRRRLLAAGCAAAAVFTAVQTLQPRAPAVAPVWVLSRDLSVGSTLQRTDLRRVPVAVDLVPRTHVRDPESFLGRTVIAPLGRGQPLPSSALLGPGMARRYPARTVLTVRFEEDVGRLLHPGDRIDLWSTDGRTPGPAQRIALGAAVVAVPRRPAGAGATSPASDRVLVLLAVPPEAVESVASAATLGFLSVAWSR